MSLDGADAQNIVIGERTRELLRAFSDFADMLAVEAPTSLLAKQMGELERLAREIDLLAETGLHEKGTWSTLVEPTRLMKLYEVLQYRDRAQNETP